MEERMLYLVGACPRLSNQEKIAYIKGKPLSEEKLTSLKEMFRNKNRYFEEYDSIRSSGIGFTCYFLSDYPSCLKNIFDPPFCLFYYGSLPKEETPAVAMVGARDCSSYGRETAFQIAAFLAEHGVCVVSGMAHGIDCASHRGALSKKGFSVAVLGCGPDICYPKESFPVYQHMMESGCILSEFFPGTKPKPYFFPKRNRLISGFSKCLLVIEAREKSGSLITVEHALEQGKDVFALPGRIGDPLSAGCNRLIQNGAALLMSPEEILMYLKNYYEIPDISIEKKKTGLAEQDKLVYSCLDLTPKHVQDITNDCGLPFSATALSLLSLVEKGFAVRVSEGYFARKPGF